MRDPVWVYDNWSAYTDGIYREEIFGGVEDDTRLTEELAMRELHELIRLKRSGVKFDYYLMNAFWFDPDGAYRKWRQPDWPNGPDRWIEGCVENGLKPGLWFGSNSLWKMNPAPQWRDSLAVKSPDRAWGSMSFYEGGFLHDFMQTLDYWYGRGIRLFEFDTAHFDATTEAASKSHSPEEVRSRNQRAFADALKAFRDRHPDVMLAAFNGFGGDFRSTASPFPFKRPVDLSWLQIFDTLYTGDIRVSDVPMMNFWRSVDLFNDHMTRRYEQTGVPLERSDPFFTLSSTWFGYGRLKRAWKGMLLLTAARGSWKKTIYGALELLTDEDAQWFARVQRLHAPLMAMGRTKTFGGIPGEIEPYGFGSFTAGGAVYTVVNPTQEIRQIDMPRLSQVQDLVLPGRVLFRDAGYSPILAGAKLSLGPEQMAVVGFGRYANDEYELGIENDIVIPQSIRPIEVSFRRARTNVIEASMTPPRQGHIRVVFWQRAADGTAPRSKSMKIEAEQNGTSLRVEQSHQEKAVSTGISWGAAEIRDEAIRGSEAVTIRCSSADEERRVLEARVFEVMYGPT